MIFHPSVIALILSSLLTSAMVIYSSFFGLQILRRWDIKSGSEIQLNLERKTYLISTILGYAFGFELLSLFLFIYTADNLHNIFVGAMCAAGTLNVNRYGYPALILKVIVFLSAGLWLIVNIVDNRGYDYPLIRIKYTLLLIIAPFFLSETVLLIKYISGLRADVITSCCGALFSSDRQGLVSELVSLPTGPTRVAFFTSITATIISGLFFYRRGKGVYIFSSLSVISFVVSIIAIISFISLYFYELPTHHCPFCLLQREYNYAGYPLYLSLFTATICGTGAGILTPFRNIESLKEVIPSVQKKLTVTAIITYIIFLVISIYPLIFSDFKM